MINNNINKLRLDSQEAREKLIIVGFTVKRRIEDSAIFLLNIFLVSKYMSNIERVPKTAEGRRVENSERPRSLTGRTVK